MTEALAIGVLLYLAFMKKAEAKESSTPGPESAPQQDAAGDLGKTLGDALGVAGTAVGALTPIIIGIASAGAGSAAGSAGGAAAGGAGGSFAANQLGSLAKTATLSTSSTGSAVTSTAVATGTMLSSSAAAAVFGFAAIFQAAIYVAAPVLFDQGRMADFRFRTRGRPRAQMLSELSYNLWRRENQLFAEFLARYAAATGKSVTWQYLDPPQPGQTQYWTNTITGERYQTTAYAHPRLVVNVAGLPLEDQRIAAQWARFFTFFEARAYNTWATLAALDEGGAPTLPLSWSTTGAGFTGAEWAQEVEGVYWAQHGLYLSQGHVAAYNANWEELDAWARSQVVTNGQDGANRLTRLLNLIRYQQVCSWFRKNGQGVGAYNVMSFGEAAAACGYELWLIQDTPRVVARGVGPDPADPQYQVVGDGYAITTELTYGLDEMPLKVAEALMPWRTP